jgi:hypothetical protein
VLSEWGRTAGDLPAILRQSVAMGLFSSAQLVRFLAMDVRPGALRSLTRALPPRAARGVVGRLMADPAFAHKLAFEVGLSAAWSLAWEYKARGGAAFWRELDYVALNTVTLAAAGAAGVWAAAPSRAAPVGGGRWAAALAGVPNHAFDAASPGRAFARSGRAASLGARGLELAAIGGAAGAVMAGAGAGLTALRRRFGPGGPAWEPAAPVPTLASAAAMAATGGLVANARLQLLGGVDRYLFEHCVSLGSYVAPALALRGAASWAAHETRLAAQGLGGILPAKAAAAAASRAAAAAALPRPPPPLAPKRRVVRSVGAGALTRRAAAAAGALAGKGEVEEQEQREEVRRPVAKKTAAASGGGDTAAPGGGGPPRRRRKKKAAPVGFQMSASASA